MGIDKTVKSSYNNCLNGSDKVREMMLASANYSGLGLCPVTEIVIEEVKPTRKRRLDHLSADEKIRRKKLKNREAAQTSRDRKKAYVTSLEEAVRLLQQQNELLSERVSILEKENEKLRRSDDMGSCNTTTSSSSSSSDEVVMGGEGVASGPAASSDPLQQGSTLSPARLHPPSHHLKATALLAVMTALTSLTGSTPSSLTSPLLSRLPMTWSKTWLNSSQTSLLLRKGRVRWWGPGGGRRAWRPPPPLHSRLVRTSSSSL